MESQWAHLPFVIDNKCSLAVSPLYTELLQQHPLVFETGLHKMHFCLATHVDGATYAVSIKYLHLVLRVNGRDSHQIV